MAVMSIGPGTGLAMAPEGAKTLSWQERHRVLIAAAVAAALEGPFRILEISPSPEDENRWAKSGRFRNRAQRPPSWTIHPATPPSPEPPPEQGGQTS